uniref:Uncharacterized protein n=1 Tax=Spongospora subterranea TaxID=70186 RepID=A0A0H5QZV1_9EUKA|eukprot:CRZ07513.1 hypothetical protein [Spongospora subterranea]
MGSRWFNGLSREHYQAHFEAIFNLHCGAIMDFSKAQHLGYIDAYVAVASKILISHNQFPNIPELKLQVASMMKGCKVHFESSAQHINRNTSIVGRDDGGQFLKLVMQAVEEPLHDAFVRAMTILHDRYPNARPWFTWWLKESVASLIFESQRKLAKEFAEKGREDSNPIESMHAVYYQIAEKNNKIVFGLSSLMLFSANLEREFEDLKLGRTVRYGVAERWKISIERYGLAHPERRRRKPVAFNDGRPPDTTDSLINDQAVAKSDQSLKRLSNSQLPPPLKKKAGRPKGTKNIDRSPVTTYQSYVHSNNTCYITALLELLSVCSNQLPPSPPHVNCRSPVFFRLLQHFHNRKNTVGPALTKELAKGRNLITQWCIEVKQLYKSGEFSCPLVVLSSILQEVATDPWFTHVKTAAMVNQFFCSSCTHFLLQNRQVLQRALT